MRKKPKIKYVEMCIYVDKNIRDPNADSEKIYEYLVMLAYMLAVKRKLFDSETYYDNYAHYIASSVYMRMVSNKPNQEPVKSCLNYMKSIISKRKYNFEKAEFDYTTPEGSEESDILKDFNTSIVRHGSSGMLKIEVEDYFKSIDKIILDEIHRGPYGNDKALVWKLYTSCLISLLRNFTLSNKNKARLVKKDGSNEYRHNYEELFSNFMEEETLNAPIVYDLDIKWVDYIAVLVQRVKTVMIKDIRELSRSYDFSDELVEDILMSNYQSSEEE